MTNLEAWTLALTVLFIGAILSLEHIAFGHRLCLENRYALGLITDVGLLAAWAVTLQVHVTLAIALSLLAAACLAGLPVYLILHYENKRQEEQWNYIIQTNRELAGELALLRVVGNTKRYSRAHELIESVCFIRGGFAKDLHDLELLKKARPEH